MNFVFVRNVKNKIHKAIAREFGIEPEKLYLTKPTFFSEMTTKPAKTIHDEYWHPHVDKVNIHPSPWSFLKKLLKTFLL